MIDAVVLSMALALSPVSGTSQCLLEYRDLERELQLRSPGTPGRFGLSRLETRCHTQPGITRSDIDDLRRESRLPHQPIPEPPRPSYSWAPSPLTSWGARPGGLD